MSTDEGFWKNRVCRPMAYAAREFEIERPNEPTIQEALWELLDKHSRKSAPDKFADGTYTSEGNRAEFDRFYSDYEERKASGEPIVSLGKIFWEAEQLGWSWTRGTS